MHASRKALADLAAGLVADGLGDLPVVVGYLDHADWPDSADGDGITDLVESFSAKRWINEQLWRPPFLNLAAKDDVDLRPGQ